MGLKTFAENVLTLEVNTIVADGIAGRKMPGPERALVEVATEYRDWLKNTFPEIGGLVWPAGAKQTASLDVFQTIRNVGVDMMKQRETPMLRRVRCNAEQLMGIFTRIEGQRDGRPVRLELASGKLEPLELLPDEIVLLRKAWELRTDEVLLQTTIQVDGHVVTRIDRKLAMHPDAALVKELHDRAVTTSIATWQKLAELISGALKGLVDLIGGRA